MKFVAGLTFVVGLTFAVGLTVVLRAGGLSGNDVRGEGWRSWWGLAVVVGLAVAVIVVRLVAMVGVVDSWGA